MIRIPPPKNAPDSEDKAKLPDVSEIFLHIICPEMADTSDTPKEGETPAFFRVIGSQMQANTIKCNCEDNGLPCPPYPSLDQKAVMTEMCATLDAHLHELKKVTLVSKFFDYIPKSIGAMAGVESLTLKAPKITRIPVSIGSLSRIKSMKLYIPSVRKIPDSLRSLNRLKNLHLNCRIQEFPDYFATFPLEALELCCEMEYFPQVLTQIRSLRVLKIFSSRFSRLRTFSEDFGNLSNLRVLDIKCDTIKEIPYSIGKMTKLTKLSIHSQNLKFLPESIGDLESLRELSIVGATSLRLPDSIGQLSHLRKLSLSGKWLETLPDTIGDLISLRDLHISGALLTELPESIGNLKHLKKIHISRTPLKSLPESIIQLAELDTLDIQATLINTVPSGFYHAHCDTKFLPSTPMWRRLHRFGFQGWHIFFKPMSEIMEDIVASEEMPPEWKLDRLFTDATPSAFEWLEAHLPPNHPLWEALNRRRFRRTASGDEIIL